MESDEFRYACRTIESIEQIPEITDEDIKQIIDEEAKLRQLAINLQAKYAERVEAQNLTGQDYYAIAGIMGLCPGNCDWYETLFPRVVRACGQT